MKKYAVIVAGGSGTRMGGGLPKQFRDLGGKPVLWWSMKAFHDEDPLTVIILVLPKEFISLWQDLFDALPQEDKFLHLVAEGGETRTGSVKNGLALIPDDNSLVAVHDGARPLATPSVISKGWMEANNYGTAIPVVPVTDSLRKLSGDESNTVDRSQYVAVQTPQVFSTSLLKEAYGKAGDEIFSDDAAVVEKAGHKVYLFEGDPDNIKITNPKDISIASAILSPSN